MKCLGVATLLLAAASVPAAEKNVARDPAAAAPRADVISLVLPWREGVELRYATEDYDDDRDADGRERTRVTSIETVRITEARDDGFLQAWSFADSRYEVLEGEPDGAHVIEGMLESLGDLVLEIELDAAGSFAGIRNLSLVAERMRPVMETALLAGFEAGLASAEGDDAADADALAKARATGAPQVQAIIEQLMAPDMLQMLLSEDAVQYNDFVGVELEEGRRYEVDVELDHPLGEGMLPARVALVLHVHDRDSDDVHLEWTTHLDREKAAELAIAVAEKMFDADIPAEAREQVLAELSIVKAGAALFRHSTGVVEMLEITQTVRAGDELKVKRRRMRLLDGDHDHQWPDDGPPTPGKDPDAG
ncbi:hypothetical protein [Luteimonas sp. A534]